MKIQLLKIQEVNTPPSYSGDSRTYKANRVVIYMIPQSGNIASENYLENREEAMSSTLSLGLGVTNAVDSEVTVTEIMKPLQLPRSIISNADDGLILNIKTFLGKPQELLNGTFASTDVATTFASVDVMNGLITTMRSNKLYGVYAIRATTVLTLQINGNPFQQGRYILAFLNTGGDNSGTSAYTEWYSMHRYSKEQVTQLPHVEVDVNCDTQGTIKIPWTCGPTLATVDSTGYTVSPGVWFIYPYSPVSVPSGSSTVSFTVWGHYDDIEIFGNSIPHAGDISSRKGKTRKKDVIQEEMSDDRPISSGLKMVADVAGAVSTVPTLSWIASPISWVSDALSKALYSWGWSKPLVIDGPCRMVRNSFPYLANSDSHDPAMPLSLFTNNHVGVYPGFAGTEQDELSLSYIKSIPSWFLTWTWTTAQAAGTSLGTIDIHPLNFQNTYVDTTNSIIAMTPVAWLGNYFNYWRGNINIHFKLVKTRFHSGRIVVAFAPQDLLTYANFTPTFNETEYLHRQIIDVRTCNEFTLEIPYVSSYNWRPTGNTGRVMGRVVVYVLDALVAPASVSSTITILMEASGGDNLEFSTPKNYPYQSIVPLNLQSGNIGSQGDPCANGSGTIGTSKLKSLELEHQSACMGEVVLSMRSLLKRSTYLGPYNSSLTNIIVLPFGWTYLTNATPGVPTGNPCYDNYSNFSSVFSLSRGGVRLRLVASNHDVDWTIFARLHPVSFGASTLTDVVTNSSTRNLNQWNFDGVGENVATEYAGVGGINLQIPQYSMFPSRLSIAAGMSTSHGTIYAVSNPFVDLNQVSLFQSGAAPKGFQYFRAGSDDCNFGGFVSIPPQFLSISP